MAPSCDDVRVFLTAEVVRYVSQLFVEADQTKLAAVSVYMAFVI